MAALAVRALGKDRVFGLLMPERDSSADTLSLSRQIAQHLGIEAIHRRHLPVFWMLFGCYRRRDEAIKLVIPNYGSGWKSKIVLPSLLEGEQYRIFSVIAQSPTGERIEARLNLTAYLGSWRPPTSSNGHARCLNIIMPIA